MSSIIPLQPLRMAKPKRCQQGLMTLLVAVIALVGVTLTVIFTSKSAVMEQRNAGTSVRAGQAAAAAQAGLEHAIAYLQDLPPVDEVVCQFDAQLAVKVDDNDQAVGKYWVQFYPNPDANNQPVPDPECEEIYSCEKEKVEKANRLRVVSCGWSDDRSARKYAITDVMRVPPFSGKGPETPLTSGLGVAFSGGAKVYNLYNNATVLSPEPLDVDGNVGNTYLNIHCPIQNLTDAQIENILINRDSATCTDATGTTHEYFPPVSRGDEGIGVVWENSMRNLTEPELFVLIFGIPKETYKAGMVSPGRDLTAAAAATAAGARGEVIWVTGDATLPSDVGSREEPVILVIDGNATVSGGVTFHGLLYVSGKFTFSGSSVFYGAVAVGGIADGAGTPEIVYDRLVLGNALEKFEVRTAQAQSWRDWPVP